MISLISWKMIFNIGFPMVNGAYLKLRKLLFWLFSFLFFMLTPFILIYSLGYKFDSSSKKFLKTGALAIKTIPRDASVSVNGRRIQDFTPCTLRELLPRDYTLDIEKEGYYPYRITMPVYPSRVANLDIGLVPRIKNAEKLKFDFKIHKFFIIKQILAVTRFVAFTDKGLYLIDEDLQEVRLLSAQILQEDLADSLLGVKLTGEKLFFWNKNNIWKVGLRRNAAKNSGDFELFYRANECIKDVFFGIKEKYLIVCDGLSVLALDINSPKVSFHVFDLRSINAGLFYDTYRETLYIRDKVPQTGAYSLFKINLISIVRDDDKNK